MKMLFSAFIESQFSYCPLIVMSHTRSLDDEIKRLHKKALRIVFLDVKTNFDKLLKNCVSFTIHHRNIQTLAIEIFKFLTEYPRQ